MKRAEPTPIGDGRHLRLLAALAGAAIGITACSTAVYQRGDRAAGSTETTASHVQVERQALTSAMTTLSNLVEKPAPDLRPGFDAFSSALDTLIAAAKTSEAKARQMAHSNDVFFTEWDKQLTSITNLDIRRRSATRRNESSTQFRAVNERYLQAQDQLRSLISYLEDLRRALRNDLTRSGLASARPLVANASAVADSVQGDLGQARSDLSSLRAEMSSVPGPARP